MDKLWNEVLTSQFLAAIEMLEKPIKACPEELWKASLWNDPDLPTGFAEFWYVTYHTLFWLDLYLFGKEEGFVPPSPFDLNELDASGLMPGRNYTKEELLSYLAHCRKKCHETIESLTDESAHRPCEFPWSRGPISFAELLLDNMRHVQEHSAQLNMYLGQHARISSRWVARVKNEPVDRTPSA
jgi:hypothetical protein